MKFRRLLITLFGLALAPALFAQDMPAATFIVGDQWTYREIDLLTKIETGQWTETVTSVDAAEYWIDSQRKARTWWRAMRPNNCTASSSVTAKAQKNSAASRLPATTAVVPTRGR